MHLSSESTSVSHRPTLGIIAGRGELPRQLALACRDQRRSYFILGIDGEAEPDLFQGLNFACVPIGKAGKALDMLRENQVKEVVFAGAIERPSLSALQVDLTGMKLMAKLKLSKNQGDDNLLRVIMEYMESEGFKVVDTGTILPAIFAKTGLLTHKNAQAYESDIALGISVLQALSHYDIGQAIIVQQQRILGIEAAEGTDNLIARCAALKMIGEPPILIKICKASQDKRADLPTIGVATIQAAVNTGLAGIIISADTTQIIDQEKAIDLANRHGLFIEARHISV